MDDNITCLNQNSHLDTSEKIFHQIYFITSIVLVLVILLVWACLRQSHVYLKKRSLVAVIINAIGQFAVLLPESLPSLVPGLKPANFCLVHNVGVLSIVPLISASVLMSTISFYNKSLLCKALSHTNKEVPQWKWFFASSDFEIVFMVCYLLTLFSSAFLVAYTSCPNSTQMFCKYFTLDNPILLSFSLGLGLITTIVVVCLQMKLRTYPDPFKLLRDFRMATIGALILGVSTIILAILFPRNGVSFGTSTNLAVHFFFMWLCPVQIYKARRFDSKDALNSSISLDKVLEDPIGHRMLKQHMCSEFSIENILFLDGVEEFKREKDSEVRYELGRSLYHKFLKKRHLNLSAHVYQLIEANTGSGRIFEDGCFDLARQQIKLLVEFDSFARFTKTMKFRIYAGTSLVSVSLRYQVDEPSTSL